MSRKISELAALIEGASLIGDKNTVIRDLVHDSRQAGRGAMFVCMAGAHVDGHRFIPDVVKQGAAALLTEREIEAPAGVAVLRVPDLNAALQKIAPYFFNYPAQQMRLIGITGTNGKTTTSYLVRALLRRAGYKVGLIGTIQIMI